MAEKPLEPRVLFYLLSFFIPLVGIILGAIYYSGKDESAKEFGKMCLIFGVLGFVAGGLVCSLGPCGFCYPRHHWGCYF